MGFQNLGFFAAAAGGLLAPKSPVLLGHESFSGASASSSGRTMAITVPTGTELIVVQWTSRHSGTASSFSAANCWLDSTATPLEEFVPLGNAVGRAHGGFMGFKNPTPGAHNLRIQLTSAWFSTGQLCTVSYWKDVDLGQPVEAYYPFTRPTTSDTSPTGTNWTVASEFNVLLASLCHSMDNSTTPGALTNLTQFPDGLYSVGNPPYTQQRHAYNLAPPLVDTQYAFAFSGTAAYSGLTMLELRGWRPPPSGPIPTILGSDYNASTSTTTQIVNGTVPADCNLAILVLCDRQAGNSASYTVTCPGYTVEEILPFQQNTNRTGVGIWAVRNPTPGAIQARFQCSRSANTSMGTIVYVKDGNVNGPLVTAVDRSVSTSAQTRTIPLGPIPGPEWNGPVIACSSYAGAGSGSNSFVNLTEERSYYYSGSNQSMICAINNNPPDALADYTINPQGSGSSYIDMGICRLAPTGFG